jgi:uncharacterized phiE125 gp8 family phage protein
MSMYQSAAKHTTLTSRPTVVTGPATEPVTVNEAKRQLFLSQSDTSQDIELASRIQAAREQWEHDTDSAVFTQTLSVTAERFSGREIVLPSRPIQSVTHVKYYDDSNVLQTLSTALYDVDLQSRAVRLKWNSSWPTTYIRWDAVTVTYVAGKATIASVPAIAKQAMLLLITYYHFGNRGDNDRQNDRRAYESLVRRYMRSTYP